MTPLIQTTVAGESVWLVRPLPHASSANDRWFAAAFSLPLALGSSLTQREERRPLAARFHVRGTYSLLLAQHPELPQWRQARQTMGSGRLAVPFWPAAATTRLVSAPWWLVVDRYGPGFTVYAEAGAPASVGATQWLVPVLLARLTKDPDEGRHGADRTRLRLEWERDGEATWFEPPTQSWEAGPATSVGATDVFPLKAQWANPPSGLDATTVLSRRTYGVRGESAVEAFAQPALRVHEQLSLARTQAEWLRLLAFARSHEGAAFWLDAGTQEARLAAATTTGSTALTLDSHATLGDQRALVLDDLRQRRVVLATSTAANPVPLSAAVGTAFGTGTGVRAALLGRFAQTDLALEWRSRERATCPLRCVEVGWELVAPGDETPGVTAGRLPRTATLFELQIGSEIWRHTNYGRALTSGLFTYTPEHLEWSGLEERLNLERNSTNLSGRWNAAGPWARLWPFRLEAPLQVRVLEVTVDDAGTVLTSTVLFRGEVESFEPKGAHFTARCSALSSLLGRGVPARPVGTRCPWTFGDGNGRCGALRATHEVEASVVAAVTEATTLTVQSTGAAWTAGTQPAHKFANGELTRATPALSRLVADSTAPDGGGVVTLTLALPVTLAAGTVLRLMPGCDGAYATCQGFGQTATFGGAPFLPPRNLLEFQPKRDGSYGGKK